MCVAIANTGAPLRWQSYSPLSRCRLPGPGRAEHRRRPARDLRVRAGGEGARLLVADVHELDVGLVPTQRVDDRVGRVADDAVDLPDPGLDHLVDQDLRHRLSHALLLRVRVADRGQRLIGRYSGDHIASWTASIGSSTWTPGDPCRHRGVDHVDGDRRRDLAQPRDVREQALGRVGRVGELGQGTGGGDEQRGRHRRGPADDHAEPEAGEHQRVVGLPDPVRRAVAARPARTGCRSPPAPRRRSRPAGSSASARPAPSGSTSAG